MDRLYAALIFALLACGPVKSDTEAEATSATGDATGTSTGTLTPTGGETEPTAGCMTKHEGDLVVSDDTDPQTLACLVEVTGELRVEALSGWSDMSALSRLEVVGGGLVVQYNEDLEALAGLESLAVVGEGFFITANPRLHDIGALGSLRRLGGLHVTHNAITSAASLRGDIVFEDVTGQHPEVRFGHEPLLTDLAPLAEITRVEAPHGVLISLERLDGLTDASALQKLAPVDQASVDLEIVELPKLTSLTWAGPLRALRVTNSAALTSLALPGVTELDSLLLDDLGLTSLEGLADLKFVSNGLAIGYCDGQGLPDITDLAGLDGLQQVTWLSIDGNDRLTSLAGLPANLGLSALQIRNNPMLPQVLAEGYLAISGAGGSSDTEVCNNLDGPACGQCPGGLLATDPSQRRGGD